MNAPPRNPNRYELPVTSMVGAMLIVLVGIAAFVGWRGLVRDNKPTPIPSVDYTAFVRAGRAEGVIATYAPTKLPDGARATSATYAAGSSPHWHLGVLTAKNTYIGVEESLDQVQPQVDQYIGNGATQGANVTLGGVVWQSYSDGHGDYGLVRTFKSIDGRFTETLVVGGTASVVDTAVFAASLTR